MYPILFKGIFVFLHWNCVRLYGAESNCLDLLMKIYMQGKLTILILFFLIMKQPIVLGLFLPEPTWLLVHPYTKSKRIKVSSSIHHFHSSLSLHSLKGKKEDKMVGFIYFIKKNVMKNLLCKSYSKHISYIPQSLL